MPEPDFSRFIAAQDPVYRQVLGELQACRKTSHWMWFIFPQIAGLGQSDMARRYAIADLAEASAYLNHPVLGPRLRAVTALVPVCDAPSATQVLGSPDDMKLRSSLTLFRAAASPGDTALFTAGIDRYFGSTPDPATYRSWRRRTGRSGPRDQSPPLGGTNETLAGLTTSRAEDAPPD